MASENADKYRYLINNLYGIINSIENSKSSVQQIPETIKTWMQINDEKLEEDVANDAINSMNAAKNSLYNAMYSMRQSMNK